MRFALVLILTFLVTNLQGLEPGVKPIGLGNAYNAVADDNSAIELNPGGLAQVKKYEIDANYLFSDEFHQWRFAVLDSVSSPLAMGLSYSQIKFNSDAINPAFKELGVTSLARAHTTTIALGGGSDYFFAGLNASYYQIKDTPRDYFWTFSGGAVIKPVPGLLNLSFTLYNFSTAGADNHGISRKWSAGASTYFKYILAVFEWSKMEGTNERWAFGIEGYLPRQISIRSGYFMGKKAEEEGYSAGISWRVQQISLNYSYQKRFEEKLNSISMSIFLF